MNPDSIFILSAKYGLLNLSDKIEPYDKTLNTMKVKEIKEWSNMVLKQMENKVNLKSDEIIFLAGKNYRRFLVPEMKNYKIPMEGLGIGKQLQWITNKL